MGPVFTDERVVETTRNKLLYLAWRRFRLPPADAEDAVQNALTTYLEVSDRYPEEDSPFAILAGIFRNKCLEHIDGSVRRLRKLQEYSLRREGKEKDPAGTVTETCPLSELMQEEKGQLILDAVAQLRPEAREMFRLMIEDGYSRKALIEHYGLNKNTLDSRLHVYRRELMRLLRKRGVAL